MKKFVLYTFFFTQAVFSLYAQIIPSSRSVDWNLAGYQGNIPSYSREVTITDFGGVGDGQTVNDQAFTAALNSLNGLSGVIYFPAGTFLFNSNLVLRDSLILRGESSDRTILTFNLSAAFDLIDIKGNITAMQTALTEDAFKDADQITVQDASGFSAGDYIKLFQNDSAIVTSDWAYHSVGQVMLITQVTGNLISLASPLRRTYLETDYPRIVRLQPVKNVGLECFTIERMDQTTDQTRNINFEVSAQCWVSGVESNMANFSHVAISTSSNIKITGCYFHHAFSYGGGGKAYGVVLQFTTGECLIENNIFNNLRHAMLLQAGANGNVFGYNYSINPYWSEFPNNLAGDIALHGNYVYANLFEGNICQNMVIDDSHGVNGPYNTFFRNEARLYGLLMGDDEITNDQNFVGNEITNNTSGYYAIYGTGHFEYGNNFKGTITPSGTENLPDLSYYLSSKPLFFLPDSDWPDIGTPYTYSEGTIPAEENYNSGFHTSCTLDPVAGTGDKHSAFQLKIFPNPVQDKLYISFDPSFSQQNIKLYNSLGHRCISATISSGEFIDLSSLREGIYFLKAGQNSYRILKLNP